MAYLRYMDGDSNVKVDTLLSYIRVKGGNMWVNNLYDEFMDADGWLLMITGVWKHMDTQFLDSNEQADAVKQMENLKQSGTAENYFIELEQWAHQATYSMDDKFILWLIKKNIQTWIIDRIYTSGMIPKSIKNGKTGSFKWMCSTKNVRKIRSNLA